ncbi:MAG: ABC transporter substrate-binding protein, partial [Deltaproteobacteria bacterium]|nr:ABC transporter substrate-binding protein [Deltaproteobacteria bacterium]
EIFQKRFLDNLLRKVRQSTVEKVVMEIRGTRQRGPEIIEVDCLFRGKEKNVASQLYWQKGSRWKIIDVSIAKAGLVANYQGQFNKIIRDHGFAEVLRRLKNNTIRY